MPTPEAPAPKPSPEALVPNPVALAQELHTQHLETEAAALRARQEDAVLGFVDVTDPQSINDLGTYLKKRPATEKGVQSLEKKWAKRSDKEYEDSLAATDPGYEGMSMTQLAKEVAEAEVNADRTKYETVNEILIEKVNKQVADTRASGSSEATSRKTRGDKDLPENDRKDAARNIFARLEKIKEAEAARLTGSDFESSPENRMARIKEQADEHRAAKEAAKAAKEADEAAVVEDADGFKPFDVLLEEEEAPAAEEPEVEAPTPEDEPTTPTPETPADEPPAPRRRPADAPPRPRRADDERPRRRAPEAPEREKTPEERLHEIKDTLAAGFITHREAGTEGPYFGTPDAQKLIAEVKKILQSKKIYGKKLDAALANFRAQIKTEVLGPAPKKERFVRTRSLAGSAVGIARRAVEARRSANAAADSEVPRSPRPAPPVRPATPRPDRAPAAPAGDDEIPEGSFDASPEAAVDKVEFESGQKVKMMLEDGSFVEGTVAAPGEYTGYDSDTEIPVQIEVDGAVQATPIMREQLARWQEIAADAEAEELSKWTGPISGSTIKIREEGGEVKEVFLSGSSSQGRNRSYFFGTYNNEGKLVDTRTVSAAEMKKLMEAAEEE